MSVRIESENGYELVFPDGLESSRLRAVDDPREFEFERRVAPFAIRGEPGLLDVRIQFEKQDDVSDDVFNFDFSAVLRPAGLFTNFRSSTNELRGDVAIPARLFPVRIRSFQIRNLSNDAVTENRTSARRSLAAPHSPANRAEEYSRSTQSSTDGDPSQDAGSEDEKASS